jgi:hypothetical protein
MSVFVAQGFFDGMLILNVDPTIKTSELLSPVQNPNWNKVSLTDIKTNHK